MATMSVNSTNHTPTTHVTPDNNTVMAEIFIAAPPERVFQALTDPEQMPQWWGGKGMYRITECAGDLRPGGKWRTVGVGKDGTDFRIDGEYLEIDRPRLLVYTWLATFNGMLKTTVRFDLEPRDVHGLQHHGPQRVGTGTFLKVRHDGFAGNIEAAKAHSQGWLRVLGWLQGFVEKGETLENRE
jgi:uncharacterized protein YndB with AHSA1/START domain